MAKKFVLIFSVFLSLSFVTAAFAAPIDFDYQIYTVGGAYQSSEQTVFSWNEKPWLYVKLPDIGYQFDITKSFWWDPKGADNVSVSHTSDIIRRETADNEVWLSFTNDTWSDIREVGEWKMLANSKMYFEGVPYIYNVSINGLAQCTVTPEPVSSVLFLLGGGALAVAGRFRKKV